MKAKRIEIVAIIGILAAVAAAVVWKVHSHVLLGKILALPQDEAIVIDVRTAEEFETGHLPMAINIPVSVIGRSIGRIEEYRDKPVVVYCRSGNRSTAALSTLKQNGFENVINAGGYKELMQRYKNHPAFR